MTPEVRFSGFNDDWELCKLSTLMDFSNGINAPKENYGKGRKMISVMDILSKEPISYDNIRNSVEVDSKTESNNKVENGDIVFVRSSEVRNEVGWAKAYLENEFALYSGFTIRGKKIFDFDAFFVELSINGKNREQIESKAGGSTRFNVSQSILKSVVISEPSLVEQKKISAFFKQLDDTIALHQDKLNHLKRLKHAFLQQMFPKIEEKIPSMRFAHFREEWEKFTLKDVIVSEIKGKAKSEMVGTETPYLETNYLNGGEISYVDSPLNVENDDVIILWDGSQAGTVYSGFSGALGSTLKALKSKESGAFLFQYLKRYQELIYKSYRTPNIPHVVKTFTTDFSIISPSLEEQKKVSSILNNLDNLIILHQKKIETIRNLKKSYLQKMFI